MAAVVSRTRQCHLKPNSYPPYSPVASCYLLYYPLYSRALPSRSDACISSRAPRSTPWRLVVIQPCGVVASLRMADSERERPVPLGPLSSSVRTGPGDRAFGRQAWRAAALSRGRPLVTCCLAASRSTVRGCSPSFAGRLAGRVGVEPVGMGDSLRLVGVSGWGVG